MDLKGENAIARRCSMKLGSNFPWILEEEEEEKKIWGEVCKFRSIMALSLSLDFKLSHRKKLMLLFFENSCWKKF